MTFGRPASVRASRNWRVTCCWDVSAWIDLQGDEEFICETEPLNAIECTPDLQDKQTRFRFILLAGGPTEVDVVIDD